MNIVETEHGPIELYDEGDLGPHEPDYLDYMIAYFAEALPEVSDTPQHLIDQSASYLRELTDHIVPPPPDLIEGWFAHLRETVQPTERFPHFELIEASLRHLLMPVLQPHDFTPLDPDGVEGTIQKLILGRKPGSFGDLLRLLKKANDRIKKLPKPSGIDLTKDVWRRHGRFELVGIDRIQMKRSFLIRVVRPYTSFSFKRTLPAPVFTDTVTAELTGFTFALTNQQTTGSTIQRGALLTTKFGPQSVEITAEYSRLNRSADIKALFLDPYSTSRTMDNIWLTIRAAVDVKYYSVLVT